MCHACSASIAGKSNEKEAIAAWNRRASSATKEGKNG